MAISAAPSQNGLAHKNHRTYHTSAAADLTATPTLTISPVRLYWFMVIVERYHHNHHAKFVTFFVVMFCAGNTVILAMVRWSNAPNWLFYSSALPPQTLCTTPLLQVRPNCLVIEEFVEGQIRHGRRRRWAIINLLQLPLQLCPCCLAHFLNNIPHLPLDIPLVP